MAIQISKRSCLRFSSILRTVASEATRRPSQDGRPAARQEYCPVRFCEAARNRVAWAKAHLKAAGLLESPRRGFYRLASRGAEVLKRNPDRVDLRLKTFPGYQEVRNSKREGDSGSTTIEAKEQHLRLVRQ